MERGQNGGFATAVAFTVSLNTVPVMEWPCA
jgi:hypothetical protein